jgi:phosphatidylglycerophosphate synthase
MDSNPGATYESSLKSDISDEPINTFIIRPIAHKCVRVLYHSSVTPNQVTVASIVAGVVAAVVYAFAGSAFIPLAGLLVTLKDILDSADGQLARAKSMYSRFGRFLDSVGDYSVNLFLFAAISLSIYKQTGWEPVFLLGLLGFLGISLRVSYHVFYQTSFLHLHSAYALNRLSEEMRDEDLKEDPQTQRMQRLFLLLYGWQDRFMMRLDAWAKSGISGTQDERWYGDRTALRFSGFLGLGTELFVMMLFSVLGRLELYLWANLVGMNALWAGCVVYRRVVLSRNLRGTEY